MKKQVYLCVDLKTITHRPFRVGNALAGLLQHDAEDHFHFAEAATITHRRNPRIWSGQHINIVRNQQGQTFIHFRKYEAQKGMSPLQIGCDIIHELNQAKNDLGL